MNNKLPNSEIDHDNVVTQWRQYAEAHDDENYEFLRSMKRREYGFDPDELAGELHKRAFEIVDCTRCANCCKTMTIIFTWEDIERISRILEIGEEAFIKSYLEFNEDENWYQARRKPCPFLGEDGRCTIYDVRPLVCREYPHTDKDGFTFRTTGVANNALVCPAVFWIVEQMKHEALG